MNRRSTGPPSAILAFITLAAGATIEQTSAGVDGQQDTVYENRVDVHVTEPQLTPRPEPLRDFPVEQVLDVGGVPPDLAGVAGEVGFARGRVQVRRRQPPDPAGGPQQCSPIGIALPRPTERRTDSCSHA